MKKLIGIAALIITLTSCGVTPTFDKENITKEAITMLKQGKCDTLLAVTTPKHGVNQSKTFYFKVDKNNTFKESNDRYEDELVGVIFGFIVFFFFFGLLIGSLKD